jgi:UDP-3-O-[3-hydroxymyristoyl] glucosamine N-acyltransferase
MTDPRFFLPLGPFTAAHLAEISGSVLAGVPDPSRLLTNVAALNAAGAEDVSFLDNRKYKKDLRSCQAGAIILSPEMVSGAPGSAVLIVNPEPYKTYARIAQLFHPLRPRTEPGISPYAMIDPTAQIGEDCTIAAGVVIEAKARLGQRVIIGANAVIGQSVEIGDETSIAAGASLSHCLIGCRVRILPGARIGQEGFGFAIDPMGHIRIPQLGRVIVEDDVEIGANVTIDRGAGPDTLIGKGTMIDNLVQIGHNVSIGPGCIIVAQAGVSGSTKLGRGVALGGQVGIAGHLVIEAGAQIASQSGVMRDVARNARMMGYPATTSRQFFRQVAWLAKAAADDNGE